MDPLVSVVIPVYNRPAMLLRAVRSVLRQSIPSFELIVVDDGSPAPLAEAERLVRENGHRWVRTRQRGVSAARNLGASMSQGRYLAFLDSDDEWLPEKLAKQLELHSTSPALLVSQTDEIWIRNGVRVNRKQTHVLASGDGFADCVRRCAISPSSVMLERELFLSTGGFDESLPVCEDYELWLRISCRHRIGLVDTPLIVKYGGHDDQLSRSRGAFDCYRLYALLRLVQSGLLSPAQLSQVMDEAERKAEVLLTGARKRGSESEQSFTDVLAILRAHRGVAAAPCAEVERAIAVLRTAIDALEEQYARNGLQRGSEQG